VNDAPAFADGGDSPYPLLFEAIPDATIVVDNHGVILLANSKACELFGWTRSELIGTKVERLIPSRFAGVHEQHRRRYNGNPDARPMGIELELFGLRSDGTEFPLEIALSPFKMGAESMVAASIRDLTHTLRFKNAAKRARYSSQVVKLGELALRSKGIDELLAEVPGFIVETLRTDVVIVYWAAHGARLRPRVIHGIPDALVGSLKLTSAIATDGRDMAVNQRPVIVNDYGNERGIDAALARALDIASGLRVPLTSKAGLVGLLATHSRQANRFGEEELHFIQAVGNVIVEAHMRGEVEEQLAHAQRLESIGLLTGGIAHDFNNILTVVLGNLQMLREALEQNGDSGFVELVESAQRASRRGADLTQKLLTFSRKQSLAPSAIDPAAVLGALTDMLQRTIGEAIQIEWQVEPGCPPCMADPLQLDNAIVNLALNARDAMPAGGRLRMTAAPLAASEDMPDIAGELAPGNYVVISVVDSGQGMPPDVLRRAYEPFFTTKPSGKGSGLGLSMVYGFAKQSGGTIRIDSEPGRGTEVRLYFPAADRGSGASASGRRIRDHGPGAPVRQESILVVDDDLEVLNVAEVFLAKSGYRVLRASDTAAALHWLTGTEPISLLFTDVVLGAGEAGPTLAADALKIRPGLPVLYTSGFAHGSLSVADVRPIQFLAKPYRREELIARIETLLTEARHQGGA
jgi:PAS domain S-box-containing protein